MPAPASGQDYWILYIFPERGGFNQATGRGVGRMGYTDKKTKISHQNWNCGFLFKLANQLFL